MLHSFKVSYYPPYEYGFEVSAAAFQDINHPDHVVKNFDKEIVRNIAIFGLNDVGKTRFIQTFDLLRELIVGSPKERAIVDLIRNISFLNSSSSRFEIQFSNNNHLFTYSLTITTGPEIIEYLYVREGDEDILVFSNDRNGIKLLKDPIDDYSYVTVLETSDSDLCFFMNDKDAKLSQVYRFVSTKPDFYTEQYEKMRSIWNSLLCDAIDWFIKICIVHPDRPEFIKQDMKAISEILYHFDTGITKVEAVDITDQNLSIINDVKKDIYSSPDRTDIDRILEDCIEEGSQVGILDSKTDGNRSFLITSREGIKALKLIFYHEGVDSPLDWNQESDGTLRLLEFCDLLNNTKPDSLFIVDEFDRKLHPIATQELLKLFNQKPEKRQQLIFTTHESSLISSDYLRDDEVRFISKSDENISKIHSVIGHNEYIYAINEKDYLNGKYDQLFKGDEDK
ncbi:ATPase AAA [methanogenic archaeon mixed culture ISO4-G1]|nr:ATPase AAA [methanogenic archaeon mixed culture ISO4-G1]